MAFSPLKTADFIASRLIYNTLSFNHPISCRPTIVSYTRVRLIGPFSQKPSVIHDYQFRKLSQIFSYLKFNSHSVSVDSSPRHLHAPFLSDSISCPRQPFSVSYVKHYSTNHSRVFPRSMASSRDGSSRKSAINAITNVVLTRIPSVQVS